jgi:hypothetical protein
MYLQQIYNFFFDFNIHASFAAFLRISFCGFCLFYLISSYKDLWNFSAPNRYFPWNEYIKHRECSIYNFKIFGNQKVSHFIIFISCYIFGITSIFGFLTKFSLILFFISYISIQTRAFILTKSAAESYLKLGLFALLFIDCGARYSIDNLIGIASNKEIVDGWALRILQIFTCSIYFFSANYKLQDKYWVNGQAIKNVIFSPLFGRRILLNIFKNNQICKIMGYSVICYQFFSPFLFLINELRIFGIIFGILLHLGI